MRGLGWPGAGGAGKGRQGWCPSSHRLLSLNCCSSDKADMALCPETVGLGREEQDLRKTHLGERKKTKRNIEAVPPVAAPSLEGAAPEEAQLEGGYLSKSPLLQRNPEQCWYLERLAGARFLAQEHLPPQPDPRLRSTVANGRF